MLDHQQISKAIAECLAAYSASNDSSEAAFTTAKAISERNSFTESEDSDLRRELQRRIDALQDSSPSAWANESPAAGQFVIATDQSPPLSHPALKRAFVSHEMKSGRAQRGRS